MGLMRFSAAPAGRLSDRRIPWAIFGEREGDPDGLEDSALAGVNLAQIASAPGAPMFETESIFGAYMAGQPLELTGKGPVVVFVHGFEYEPRRPVVARCRSDNPHRAIFHFSETPDGPGSAEERMLHITPWFARGMIRRGQGAPEDCRGLAIGYSYASRGGSQDAFLPGHTSRMLSRWGLTLPGRQLPAVWANAYQDAEIAGYGLAAVLTQLRVRLDAEGFRDRRIDILCHSLGARVVMTALGLIAQRWPDDRTLSRIDRVLMLGGACYWGQAAYGLANITFAEADPRPQFYNFTSQSDEVLRHIERHATLTGARREAEEDLSTEGTALKLLRGGQTIGRSGKPPHALYEFFGPDYADWIDIALDEARVRRWGRENGFDLRGRQRAAFGDHHIHFTHPGNWSLYRAILHRRDGWTARELAEHIGPR